MKNKVKKVVLSAGALASALGIIMPMTAYAEVSKNVSSHTEVKVMPAITLEVVVEDQSSEEEQQILFDKPVLGTTSEADFSATVSTNQAYTLSLNALDGQTDMLPAGVSSDDAPVGGKIPGTADIAEGKTSWGVKLASEADFQAIPAVITKFYDGENPVQDAKTLFTVGLATGLDLLNGTYSSTLVVTAATK